jgi:hypothetical protein
MIITRMSFDTGARKALGETTPAAKATENRTLKRMKNPIVSNIVLAFLCSTRNHLRPA